MPPEETDEGFDQALAYYSEKYNALIKAPQNLPPAAACVVLLCAQLERTFFNVNDVDEDEDG